MRDQIKLDQCRYLTIRIRECEYRKCKQFIDIIDHNWILETNPHAPDKLFCSRECFISHYTPEITIKPPVTQIYSVNSFFSKTELNEIDMSEYNR